MKLSISAGFGLVLALQATWVFARDRDQDNFNFSSIPQRNPAADQARNEADQAYQRGEYQKVIELADRLLASFPADNPHVAYHLRASARIELGRQAGSAKQVRDGITDARTALASAGNQYRWLYVPYIYGLASLAEIERRPEHAEMALKVVGPILAQPTGEGFSTDDKANLYFQRGMAYAAKQDLKSAAADWSEAIRLNPQHLTAHMKLAEAYVQMGQPKAAVAAFDSAARQFPSNAIVFNNRATFRRGTGDLDGAVADFSRAVQFDRQFAMAYFNRGLCLAEQNNPRAAEADYGEALKFQLDPATQLLAYRLRAQSRLSQGNAAGALTDYAAALRVNPRDATLYEERGFVGIFKKDFAAAIADFDKALQLDPNLARVIPWRALALARAGKTAEAKAQLSRVAELKASEIAWVVKLCEFLDDRISEGDLLAAVTEFGETGKQARLCEARYFIGQKKVLAAEDAAAAEQFREAVATKVYPLSAYRGARYELGEFSRN